MPSLASLCAPLVLLCLLTAGCSTPISPYSPLEDFDEEDDELPDGGVVPTRDAGARDAGARDAGSRDAGARDAAVGAGADCTRIAQTEVFGSFVDGDCVSRTAQACAGPGQPTQAAVNQRLANAASRCGAPLDSSIAVIFGRTGCPSNYGYNRALQGRTWACIERELDSWRLSCAPACALTGPLAR